MMSDRRRLLETGTPPFMQRYLTLSRFSFERLYQPLIILSLLAITALLAYRLSPRQAKLLLGLLGMGVAAWVFLRWPPLGLATLIVAALTVPFAIGTGTQTSINIAILLVAFLAGLWLFDNLIRGRRLGIRFSRPVWALLGLAVAVLLAFLVGQMPWFPISGAPMRAQVGGLAVFLLSIAAFLLAAHQIPDVRWLQWLTWLFLGLGGVFLAGRIIPGASGLTKLFPPGATGSLFWVWLVALAFSQALFNKQLSFFGRVALWALVLATFYVGLGSGRSWASGWLPPLVALAGVLFIAAPRWGVTTFALGGFVGLWKLQSLTNIILATNNQYSYITRLAAWRILLFDIVKLNPILGLGPANYYWYTALFPIMGWYVVFNSHNQYMDLLAQTGVMGLFFYLWFFWEMLRLAWRMRNRTEEGFARAYVYGVFGGMLGTLAAGMLGDWVLPFVYNIGLAGFRASVMGWVFMGALLAIATTKNDESK